MYGLGKLADARGDLLPATAGVLRALADFLEKGAPGLLAQLDLTPS